MTSPKTGLSTAEAASRLRAEGFNELPRGEQRTVWRITAEVLSEPMFLLLLASGGIYLLLGDLTDALILLAFASLSVSIAIIQESRSEHVLAALRDLTSPRALVIRDGERQRIPGREVVRGDLIVLGEGDRVPADATLLSATNLLIDESLLTGESVPVRKAVTTADATERRPGGDDLPYVFSGSLVVGGEGIAEVHATGAMAEIGRIGKLLATIEPGIPRLRKQTRNVVRVFAIAGVAASVVATVLFGLLRGSWLDALLAGIALSMSLLPEEFPLVLAVFMVMGAWRISRHRVLTRRAASIETLGAATVLCTDKTGTLTENRMTVTAVVCGEDIHRSTPGYNWSGAAAHLVTVASLASSRDPADPMEKAIHAASSHAPVSARSDELCASFGLQPDLLAVTNVWRKPGEAQYTVACKGAPEAVARLCRFDNLALGSLRQTLDKLAAEGMRLLAVAEARFDGAILPTSPQDFAFTYLGLLALTDPLRTSVPDAVRECREAGIRVVMITGDYPATARAIAQAAGIDGDHVIAGQALEAMSDAELEKVAPKANVFARITPQQKLRIVRALQAQGEVVAMTGDGVNDAPSLKAADIGIAMGGRGTDVAREAASLVLLDDDFGSIVRAIRLGRRIYDNIQKAMAYILAVHVPIAGMALLPLLTGFPLVLFPMHIAFLEMVIDPVCSIAFEAEPDEPNIMRRRPRPVDAKLLGRDRVLWGLLQGTLAITAVAVVYLGANWKGLAEEDVRGATFAALVAVVVALIFANRSFSSAFLGVTGKGNRVLWRIVGFVILILAAAYLWPTARELLHFGILRARDIAVAGGAGFILFLSLETVKLLRRKRTKGS